MVVARRSEVRTRGWRLAGVYSALPKTLCWRLQLSRVQENARQPRRFAVGGALALRLRSLAMASAGAEWRQTTGNQRRSSRISNSRVKPERRAALSLPAATFGE
jgi:hypothetical protein